MADFEVRRFIQNWRFECGGPKKGPEFKKGQTVLCTADRAAALDRRGLVEPVKNGKGKAFEEIVAAWRESAGAPEEVTEHAIVAESDKAADGDDAGDKPSAQSGGDREKGASSRKP